MIDPPGGGASTMSEWLGYSKGFGSSGIQASGSGLVDRNSSAFFPPRPVTRLQRQRAAAAAAGGGGSGSGGSGLSASVVGTRGERSGGGGGGSRSGQSFAGESNASVGGSGGGGGGGESSLLRNREMSAGARSVLLRRGGVSAAADNQFRFAPASRPDSSVRTTSLLPTRPQRGPGFVRLGPSA